jgi:tight adherence protein C
MTAASLALVSALCLALASQTFLRFVRAARSARARERIRAWTRPRRGAVEPAEELDLPFRERILRPLWRRVAGAVEQRVLPEHVQREWQRRLRLAGLNQSPAEYLLARTLAASTAALLGAWLAHVMQLGGLQQGLVPVGLGLVIWMFFGVRLNTLAERRRQEIERGLPEVLDWLSVSVEAGLSFEAALRRTAARTPGPMGHELQRVVADLQLGLTRAEALEAMAERTRLEEVQRFASLVAQAERMGAGMSAVLKAEGQRVKEDRVNRAREQAALVPVKILFPLALFILPTLFVAILGGGIISLVGSLSHGL